MNEPTAAKIVALLLLLLAVAAVVIITLMVSWSHSEATWTREAIKHGAMRYNEQTGVKEWVTKVEGE